MRKIRTAVIGAGSMGQVHSQAYSGYDGAELVTICDVNERLARRQAHTHGCRYAYRVEDVARDPEIEAVSVATPDFAHRKAVEKLAAAGKHILVEKPLADKLSDATAMARVAKRHKIQLMVDFHKKGLLLDLQM